MTKKLWLTIAAVFLLLLLTAVIASHTLQEEKNVPSCIEDALGDEWNKQTVTEVSKLVYSDDKGNTIIYYVCITTHFEAGPDDQTSLNTNAITAVIDPNEAEHCQTCTVSGLPAATYQKDGRAYLCWTVTPELSCVIEYDPTVENKADIFRMAESIPANTMGTSDSH